LLCRLNFLTSVLDKPETHCCRLISFRGSRIRLTSSPCAVRKHQSRSSNEPTAVSSVPGSGRYNSAPFARQIIPVMVLRGQARSCAARACGRRRAVSRPPTARARDDRRRAKGAPSPKAIQTVSTIADRKCCLLTDMTSHRPAAGRNTTADRGRRCCVYKWPSPCLLYPVACDGLVGAARGVVNDRIGPNSRSFER
jgi:hypothetical protein